MTTMKQVTRDEFFAHVGRLNVHPKVDVASLKDRHHRSRWELPNRVVVGESLSDSHGGEATLFWLTE